MENIICFRDSLGYVNQNIELLDCDFVLKLCYAESGIFDRKPYFQPGRVFSFVPLYIQNAFWLKYLSLFKAYLSTMANCPLIYNAASGSKFNSLNLSAV